jgi:hypothetical protein
MGSLPLVRTLKREIPTTKQQWFADDGSSADPTTRSQLRLRPRIVKILVAPHNVAQAKLGFTGLTFQVETGSRYLGSFIGEVTERNSWIVSKEAFESIFCSPALCTTRMAVSTTHNAEH